MAAIEDSFCLWGKTLKREAKIKRLQNSNILTGKVVGALEECAEEIAATQRSSWYNWLKLASALLGIFVCLNMYLSNSEKMWKKKNEL